MSGDGNMGISKAKSKKTRFKSLSTPDLKQDLSSYLTELAFLRQNRGNRLPPKFWRQTKYKARYRKEIMACRKFIKKYGERAVLYIALNNYIRTWTDFARVEFLLQQQKEAQERRCAPKDHSRVQEESIEVKEDYRDFHPTQPRRGLFERLKELKNG